jgi:GGDEF domain-containing protein
VLCLFVFSDDFKLINDIYGYCVGDAVCAE